MQAFVHVWKPMYMHCVALHRILHKVRQIFPMLLFQYLEREGERREKEGDTEADGNSETDADPGADGHADSEADRDAKAVCVGDLRDLCG